MKSKFTDPINQLMASIDDSNSNVPERIKRVLKSTIISIPRGHIDCENSFHKTFLHDMKSFHLRLRSKGCARISIDLTISQMLDLHFSSASVFEMKEITTPEEEQHVISTINMWLASEISVTEISRGDYITKTVFTGSHKYMSERDLYIRTSVLGSLGSHRITNYRSWIEVH